jgi:hypothetical protein
MPPRCGGGMVKATIYRSTRGNSPFFTELMRNGAKFAPRSLRLPMKNFADAAFSPEVIEIMTAALEASIGTLPEPVTTAHINMLAESILRTAKTGERDAAVLQRIALVELQITPRS